MMVNSVTHYPGGLSINPESGPLGNLPVPISSQIITLFDDFDVFDTSRWNVFTNGTAAVALIDENNGVIEYTNTTQGNVGVVGMPKNSFPFIVGKKSWVEARLSLIGTPDTADEVYVALSSGLAGFSNSSVGIGIGKPSGAAQDFYLLNKDGTGSQSVLLGTFDYDDTFITLGFIWDGVDTMTGYVNGGLEGELVVTTIDGAIDIPLKLGVELLAGTATIGMKLDYLFAAKERDV